MERIAIIDFGMGNLHSVLKAVTTASNGQHEIILTTDAGKALAADKLIIPGQGAIKGAMSNIKERGLDHLILSASQQKPIFAICIGPQLLMEHSEENGGVDALGLFQGTCHRFPESVGEKRLKIPHMGWNAVKQTKSHVMFEGIMDHSFFYFVHSYYLKPKDDAIAYGNTNYQGLDFTSVIAKDNIFATQCHPEKSGEVGLKLFANFLKWRP